MIDVENAVLAAIRQRRTVREFTDAPVSDETLTTLLEAATWAPNHKSTEPWRFFVLRKDSEARSRIADLIAAWTYENIKNPSAERRKESSEDIHREVMGAPAFVYVFAMPGRDEEMTKENYAATACAVQNLQLAAHALGLGVGWSTGKACLPAQLKRELGAQNSWLMVGALFIGYPAVSPESARKPVDEVTRWL